MAQFACVYVHLQTCCTLTSDITLSSALLRCSTFSADQRAQYPRHQRGPARGLPTPAWRFGQLDQCRSAGGGCRGGHCCTLLTHERVARVQVSVCASLSLCNDLPRLSFGLVCDLLMSTSCCKHSALIALPSCLQRPALAYVCPLMQPVPVSAGKPRSAPTSRS
jgi:hypothetical protein